MVAEADSLDQASVLTEADTACALAAQLAKPDPYGGPPFLHDPDSGDVLCWECMEPISPERQAAKANAAFCVPCQERLEKHPAGRGRSA